MGLAPVPRLARRVGRADPAATRLRVRGYAAESARAVQPAAAALALHQLAGLADAEAVPVPARLFAPGAPPLPHLAHLGPVERAAILESIAHGHAYPPHGEEALQRYIWSRVERPLRNAPAGGAALEEALAALLRLGI